MIEHLEGSLGERFGLLLIFVNEYTRCFTIGGEIIERHWEVSKGEPEEMTSSFLFIFNLTR